jgi:DNA gyrase subunit A
MGRPASGVTGINLSAKKDRVVGMELARPEAALLVVTKKGQGKQTLVDEYPVKGRATGGVITMRLRDGDEIAVARVVEPTDTLTFITRQGIVIKLAANSISTLGRSTQGVRVMDLKSSDEVAAMSVEPFTESSNPAVMSSAEAAADIVSETDAVSNNGRVNGSQQGSLL